MIKSEMLTVSSCRTEVGITKNNTIVVCVNNLEQQLGWTVRGKTSEDVLQLLKNSDWGAHFIVEDSATYFREIDNKVSTIKQIWVDLECLQFLVNESDEPSLIQPFLDYIKDNEKEMKEELLNGLSYDSHSSE